MIKLPHWTIFCVALGAFLLPLLGGHVSIESGSIAADENILKAILSGGQAPFLTHFLISLLFFVPICATLLTKKISHVVNIRITFSLAVFGACVGLSIIFSSFPAVTLLSILDWTMMALSFFAVALCCGRKQSRIPLNAFLAGATIAAMFGVMEYTEARLTDPGWRIFALQVGPNQAGALFAAGTILCLAMSLNYERLPRLAFILGAVMQCFALILTQSKGAIYCLPIGLVVLILGLLMLKATKPGAVVTGIVLPLILAGGLSLAAQNAAKTPDGSAPMSRVVSSGGEATQSAGFRKLLWASAIDLVKQKPYGWGMGTYWYESTRPGKVTQTTLAHQTFLQLASEASPVAAISLLSFFGAVLVWGLRGIRKLSSDSQVVLVGVLGTMVVLVAHNFIDSDMYVFGLGSLVFMLCGAFCASSSDSQAPEFIFTLPKVAFGATALLLIPLCISTGVAEMYRAMARGALNPLPDESGVQRRPDPAVVLSNASSAISSTLADGQAYSLRALVTRDENDLLAATSFHPSPKAYRALADYYLANKKVQECYRALDKALERDPNNASALKKFYEAANEFGDKETATEKAKRLIATEETTYFQVRSQPEFVPTQTYVARMFLSRETTDDKERLKLLTGAAKGFITYRNTTGPVVMRNLRDMPNGNFAGEDRKTLETNYRLGLEACHQIIDLQRRLATTVDFDPMLEAERFDAALLALNK